MVFSLFQNGVNYSYIIPTIEEAKINTTKAYKSGFLILQMLYTPPV